MNVQFKLTNFKTILQMIEQLHKNIYDYYLYHFNLLVSFTIHKLNAKKDYPSCCININHFINKKVHYNQYTAFI